MMKPQRKLSFKRRLGPALFLSCVLLHAAPAFAGSGTWLANPGTGDWNTSANWLGGTVPNGLNDVATFDSSSVTGVSISANTAVNGIVFNAGANAYTITASPTFTLTLSGVGIVNNSGNTQSFVAAVNGTSGLGTMIFSNFATAGNNTAFTASSATVAGASSGDIEFRDSSTAGSGAFTLVGSTVNNSYGGIVGFSDAASAGNGTFTINGASGPAFGGSFGGLLQFRGAATAANGSFTNNGATVGGINAGFTQFYNSSTAGSGVFVNNGNVINSAGAGGTIFNNTSTAGNGTFTNNGSTVVNGFFNAITQFNGGSSAGSGTFTSNGGTASGGDGGLVQFNNTSSAGNGTFTANGSAFFGASTCSGSTQFNGTATAGNGTFTTNPSPASGGDGGTTQFNGYSTGGNGTFINNGASVGNAGAGLVKFNEFSTAGNGVFTNYAGTASGTNGGAVIFNYTSTAGNGTFINAGSAVSGASAGSTQFFDSSLGGHSTITNNGGTGDGANGADTDFYTSSDAQSSTVTNNGGTVSGAKGGSTQFRTSATANNATVTANAGAVSGALGGTTQFWDNATAANATLIANGGTGGGGSIQFNTDATGGTARVKVYDNGNLDISSHNAPGVTIGSLEGNGNVFLGARTLSVGSRTLDTTFPGVIQDGGTGGGAAGTFAKIGSSTLTLTGANTFTGTLAANGGMLVADTAVNASVLNSSSTLAVGGGTFQLKGNSGAQSQTLAGLAVNAGASVVDVNNLGTSTTLDLGAAITRAAGGTVDFKASSGTLGTNAVIKTSQANVNGILGGWATVNGGAALATRDGSNAIVPYTGYAALDAQGGGIADDSTLNYGINAAGTNGSISLAAATTNINTLTQNFGTAATIDAASKTLRVGTSGGIFITPTNAALTVGTAANSGTVTAGGNVTNGAGELILSNFSNSVLTINSIVANNGSGVVSLTKSGAGPAVINGTNTFTGGTVLNSGTLTLGNVSALGTAARTLKLTGGTLDLATDTTVNAWPTTVASSATILSDKATAASAGITHTLGTLAIGAQTLSIGAGANVAADSSFGITLGATTLSGDPVFNVANNGAGIGTLTLGRITDGGIRTITKTGPGTLAFATAVSSTSLTAGTALVVNNGTAQVNIANALGTSSVAVYASVTVNATTPGTTATFKLNNVSQRIAFLTLGGTGGTSTSTNNVATGTGTLTLDGNVTYDATGNPLGSTISGIVANGGLGRTFTVGDSSNAAADLTISANLTGNTSSGDISLIKTGAGTLVLSGANTFNRGMSINAGVVSVGTLPTGTTGSSTVGTGGTVQLAGGTLRYTGATQTTSHVFAVASGGGALELTQSGTVLTISSGFAGAGSAVPTDALVKSGPGTLVFTGSTDNAGLDVTVNAGLLQLSKTSSSTKHAISQGLVVNNGGTAQLGTAGSGGDQLQDAATVTVNTGGTFDFNGKSESFDGLGGSGGSITNTGAANSTMTVGASNNIAGATTFGGVISDGATNKILFTKTGRGTQTLTGANTYTGATTINGGKLVVDGSLSASSAVAVNSTGTLGGHGTVGAVTINSGGKISPGNSPGTMNTGAETWAGGAGYVWEINDASDAVGAKGASYDWLNAGGTLNITATNASSATKFTIYVTSLTSGNAAGSTPGFVKDQTYQWVIASVTSVTNFGADKFLIDTSAFFNDPTNIGGFAIAQVGNNLVLNYTAIPEPREYALAIAALLGGIILLRRRQLG